MTQTEETAFPRLTSAELALVKPLAKPCDYADGANLRSSPRQGVAVAAGPRG